jgi:uncharacterized membrane protein
LAPSPHLIALASAFFSAVSIILIQRGLYRSNFYAGFWINVVVGVIVLWAAVLALVPFSEYSWRAVPYFALAGLVGTTGGRLFRVISIEKVGAPVAASINNLQPFIAAALAIAFLGEHVTAAIVAGTFVIVAGTILLSLSGKHVGFRPGDLIFAFLSATCFGVVQIIRKLGLGHAGPLFGAALNMTAALIFASAFVMATGHVGSLRCGRRSLAYFAAAGLAENTGVFLLLMALGLGEVSVVTPLAGTAPLFVLLLALAFPSAALRLGWRVVVGALLVVLGVFLLTGKPWG